MARAVIYLRVSTDEQTLSGLGLEAQEHACRAWAEREGYEPVGPYLESEGVCGATPLSRRPALVDALGIPGQGDVLLVAKRDRVARDRLVTAAVEGVLKKRRARLVSAAGEGTEHDGIDGFILRGIIDLFAEYERLVIRVRTKMALAVKKRRDERTGGVPFGWEVDSASALNKRGKPGGLKPHPVEQERLRLIHALADEGRTAAAIAGLLNAQGVPTKTQRGAWAPKTVTKILARELRRQ